MAAMEHGYARPPLKEFAPALASMRSVDLQTPIVCEVLARLLLDVLVQAVAVRVHRDDRREILDREMPHRFGRAELEQRHAVHALIVRA